jgi:magnesium chelatase subunit D
MPTDPSPHQASEQRWADALLAAQLISNPAFKLSGLRVVARHGAVRERWLEWLHMCAASFDRAVHAMSGTTPMDRLAGGLDIAATLASSRPVVDHGILPRSHGGILVASGAERLPRSSAAIICNALDTGVSKIEAANLSRTLESTITFVALDESESEDDNPLAKCLQDRLELTVRLEGLSIRDCFLPETAHLAQAKQLPYVSDDMLQLVAATSEQFEDMSARKLSGWVRVARCLAALENHETVSVDHVNIALRLVHGLSLAPPSETKDHPEERDQPAPPPEFQPSNAHDAAEPSESPSNPDEVPEDMEVLAEAGARIDPALLAQLTASRTLERAASNGKSGDERKNTKRGRPAGFLSRPPYPGARPNVIATLRAAAPWQPLRRRMMERTEDQGIIILPSDFRYQRRIQPRETAAIFAVDASGSTALDRLGEAKGAIELLLADCYVRRDYVALVAFRGQHAEVLLEPTRSLVRAKKSLSSLPGGGATPLASGIKTGYEMAIRTKSRGQTPLFILLSDGSGNIALSGDANRQSASQDASAMARFGAGLGIRSLFIDIARRPKPKARELASAMQADYCALPHANAAEVSSLVSNYMQR